jgi:hypothetical protein
MLADVSTFAALSYTQPGFETPVTVNVKVPFPQAEVNDACPELPVRPETEPEAAPLHAPLTVAPGTICPLWSRIVTVTSARHCELSTFRCRTMEMSLTWRRFGWTAIVTVAGALVRATSSVTVNAKLSDPDWEGVYE